MTGHLCWCDRCGTELYAGSFCYRIGGQRICPDCLADFAREYFRSALELIWLIDSALRESAEKEGKT